MSTNTKRKTVSIRFTPEQIEQLKILLDTKGKYAAVMAQVWRDGMSVTIVNEWQARQIHEITTGRSQNGQGYDSLDEAIVMGGYPKAEEIKA